MRADNVRRLTVAGWQAALDHGVRRLVDLRFEDEGPGEPNPPRDVEVVAVSLFGRHDPDAARAFDESIRDTDDIASVFAAGYIRTLADSSQRVAAAVAAVADSDLDDGVVVHCFAGKDRTGIVSALLLGVADVPDDIVAADYTASGPGVEALSVEWIATAESESELELRRRIVQAPHATMVAVLAWLRDTAGGAGAYLREAGLSEEQIARLQTRLVDA